MENSSTTPEKNQTLEKPNAELKDKNANQIPHKKDETNQQEDEPTGGVEMAPLFGEIWAVKDFEPYDPSTFIPKLEVGDEIWIKDDTQGYAHVLVYIGNEEVVHVSNVEKPGLKIGKTIISRDRLSDVATGELVGIRKTEASKTHQQEIVDRAVADVGKYMPYILTRQNCEHQVKYWITGDAHFNWATSTQVRDHVVIGGTAGLIGLAIGSGVIGGVATSNVYAIIFGGIGCGILAMVLALGVKYGITAIEHRSWYCF